MSDHNNIYRRAILGTPKQFEFTPEVMHQEKLGHYGSVIIAGMGGSHLAADLLGSVPLPFRLSVHEDYGLPLHIPEDELKRSLVIASSFSGNTEETLDACDAALARGIPLAIIASGGILLERARANNIPHVILPNDGIQPRSAIGLFFIAFAKILRLSEILAETRSLSATLHPLELDERGVHLAERLHDKIPIVYSSAHNYGLAYFWKIVMNETAKIPAFYNVLPEVNHNEMTGYDMTHAAQGLGNNIAFVFLKDAADHPRIQKRMRLLEGLYTARGLPVETVEMKGENVWQCVFNSVLLAEWTAYYLAQSYVAEANDVAMVEEFKKKLAQ